MTAGTKTNRKQSDEMWSSKFFLGDKKYAESFANMEITKREKQRKINKDSHSCKISIGHGISWFRRAYHKHPQSHSHPNRYCTMFFVLFNEMNVYNSIHVCGFPRVMSVWFLAFASSTEFPIESFHIKGVPHTLIKALLICICMCVKKNHLSLINWHKMRNRIYVIFLLLENHLRTNGIVSVPLNSASYSRFIDWRSST